MNHSHEFIAIPKLCVDKYLMKGREERRMEGRRGRKRKGMEKKERKGEVRKGGGNRKKNKMQYTWVVFSGRPISPRVENIS